MKPPRHRSVPQKVGEECGRAYPPIHRSITPVLALFLFTASLSAQTFADYPVPADILRFADTLHLTEEQIKNIEAISDGINAHGQQLGIAIIAKEEELQELLLMGEAVGDETRELAAAIVGLRGRMLAVARTANLEANHLLTRSQGVLYGRLRRATSNALSGGPLRPEGTR